MAKNIPRRVTIIILDKNRILWGKSSQIWFMIHCFSVTDSWDPRDQISTPLTSLTSQLVINLYQMECGRNILFFDHSYFYKETSKLCVKRIYIPCLDDNRHLLECEQCCLCLYNNSKYYKVLIHSGSQESCSLSLTHALIVL